MELKTLYKATNKGHEEIINEKTLEYRKKYPQWFKNFEVREELGKLWIEGVEISVIGEKRGRCYYAVDYEIKSSKKLTENDMKIIRAQYDFLEGQRTGDVNLERFTENDGKFIYKAFSECDSGD